MENKKLFVWDFHGVLEKGNDFAVLEVTNTILERNGYSERLSIKDCFKLSGKKWFEYFQYLLPNKSLEILKKLQNECFFYSCNNPQIINKHILVNDHVNFVLDKISKSKHEQILISNTTAESLNIYLELTNLNIFFPEKKHFAADAHSQEKVNKSIILRKFLKDEKFLKLVTIGDSEGDMILKKHHKNGTSYLYSHPEKSFRTNECDYKINDLRQILVEI